MLIKLRKMMTNQKGFTLIELLVVISILGVLAAIAIPRFSNATAKANTAKIAADLRTIDSAISMNEAVGGAATTDIGVLVTRGYLTATPPAPTGTYMLGSIVTTPTTATYTIPAASGTAAQRALYDSNTAEYFK